MCDSDRSPTGEPIERVVRDVLRDWDPEGLIEMGLPENEYEPEAKRICDRIATVSSPEDVIDLLQAVFTWMFGRAYSWQECRAPGKLLFQRLQASSTGCRSSQI